MQGSLPKGCKPNYRVLKDGFPLYDLQVVRLLGSGLSGFVLLVKNLIDGKLYALKIMDLAGHDAEIAQTIRSEPEILRKVSGHRNVSGMLFWWEEAEVVYILLPYLSGGSLFDLFSKGRVGEIQLVKTLASSSSAIRHLHQLLIIHR